MLQYTYDAEGRVTSMAGLTYSYDLYTGKTAQITMPTVYSPNYTTSYETLAYGPAGERALKRLVTTQYSPVYTTTVVQTKYLHGSNDWPLVEYEETTVNSGPQPTKVTRYIYGPGGILAIHTSTGSVRRKDSTMTVPLTDHIGSTHVVLSVKVRGLGADATTQLTAATLAEKYRYFPFGAVAARSGSLSEYVFTGQEFDSETGLHNFRARMMSGSDELGRFFAIPEGTRDPQAQFHSPYVYAANNPVSLTDPDGEFVPLVIVGGMVVGAYMGGVMANNGDFTPFGGKQGSWDFRSEKTWKYMVAGAIVGGLSAQTGFAIATSGIPMANTAAIMGSSIVNSVGTHIYTEGMTDITISFGAGSYNFSKNEWGYLGKEGNSRLENVGYGLGAFSNLVDVFGVINPPDANFKLRTDNTELKDGKFDPGHSSIVKDGKTEISFGPVDGTSRAKSIVGTKSVNNYYNSKFQRLDLNVRFNTRSVTQIAKTLPNVPYSAGLGMQCAMATSITALFSGHYMLNLGLAFLNAPQVVYYTLMYEHLIQTASILTTVYSTK